MDITCPHCGAAVVVEVEYDAHNCYGVKTTMACEEISCGAIWDSNGKPVRTPEQYRTEIDALTAQWRREDERF